jgi:hypothetical protein
VHHQPAQRCVKRALAYGPMAALDDMPRPGKEPTITAEAQAWVMAIAYRKASAYRVDLHLSMNLPVTSGRCAGPRTTLPPPSER